MQKSRFHMCCALRYDRNTEQSVHAVVASWSPSTRLSYVGPEPALGIGKLGSRLGLPIGGGLAQES